MEPRELSLLELQETYGGNTSGTNIGIDSSTDTLLTLNYEWHQGDKSYEWKLEIGKNVHANVDIFSNRIS